MIARNYVFVGLVIVASRAFGAPFNVVNNDCDKKLSRFPNGQIFIYDYEGTTTSGVIGTSDARSALKITARCEIESSTHCDHTLRITNAELWEAQSLTPGSLKYSLSKGSAALSRELEKYELQFQTSKGAVTNLFNNAKETDHILNIKRGVLSALQLQQLEYGAKDLEEVDVTGKCSGYHAVQEINSFGTPKTITKFKDLTDCMDRSVANLGMNLPAFNDTTFNPLSSISECTYKLKVNGAIEEVICTEKHVFRPFSGAEQESGAITTTSQKLRLSKYGRLTGTKVTREGLQATTLRFVHPKKDSTSREFSEIDDIINEMVRITDEETKPEHARLFSRLVYNLRKMDKKALVAIWSKYYDCEKAKTCKSQDKDKYNKYILDSFVHCTTEPCSEVMIDLIKNEDIVGETANVFLMGLALQPSPTPNMITDVLYLCQKKPSRSSMLTLGTIVNKYCQRERCTDLSILHPISKSLSFLAKTIGTQCESKNLANTEMIILALKAIGNAGLPFSVIPNLAKCAVNSDVPMNVSLAALEALRLFPCEKYPTRDILSIYGDLTKDVELRIAAYLALMRCPHEETVEKIINIHQSEASNQVGSFVWSHMTNMLESTAPFHHRRTGYIVKKALKDKTLREFNLDLRKFSRAWEGSFFHDYSNSGASVEAHTIFHPSSYFPRSTNINMSVELMGATMNVLEANARFEGVETLLEQFFGPEGIFPDERITEMFDLKDEEGNSPNKNRNKRDIKDDFNLVERNLEDLHKKVNMKRPSPSGSLSMKVLGQEMRLLTYDDINWLMSEADNINVIEKLIQLAKGGKYTYRKSFVFLEADITVPTGLGLPLLLQMNGTTVGSVEFNGKFDIRNLFWGKPSMDIRGYVKPSSVVELTGEMGVDAVYATAGLLVNASVFSSTSIKGNVTYRHGEVLKVSMAAPEEPMQLFNMSSALFTVINGDEKMIQGPDARFEPDFCVNATTILGLGVCTRLSVPAPNKVSQLFPLGGPTSFGMKLIRTDPDLTTYNLDVLNLPSEDELTYEMVFHSYTPGAMYERNLETNATFVFYGEDTNMYFTMGALGYTFGTLEGGYNNITHETYVQFSTTDIILGNPIKAKAEFFNRTSEEEIDRDVGLAWSLMYKNYTIDQVTEFYRHENNYGFLSNLTYWPGKHILAEAEISKSHFKLLGSDSITKTLVVLDGNLGDKINSLGFNITNTPMNYGISMRSEHVKINNTLRMVVFALPCQQTITASGWLSSTETEKGLNMHFRHENKNREATWYAGFVNTQSNKGLLTNASYDGKKVEAKLSYFTSDLENGLKFSAKAMENEIGAIAALHSENRLQKVRLTGSYNDRTAQIVGSFKSDDFATSLCLSGELDKKTIAEMCSTYLNKSPEKAIVINGTILDKSAQISASYFNTEDEYATRLQAKYMKTYIEAWSSYHHSAELKAIRMNATGMDKTINTAWELQTSDNAYEASFKMNYQNENLLGVSSRYIISPGRKMIGLAANFKDKTADIQLIYANTNTDKSLGMQVLVMGQKTELKGTYITMEGKKGVNVHLVYGDKTLATAGAMYSTKQTTKAVKLTMMVNKYMTVFKTELKNNELKELIMTTVVKKDNHVVYKDHMSFGYKNTPTDKALSTSLGWEYNQKKYKYGWAMEYKDNSYVGVQSSELTFTLAYGNGKKMTWDYTYTNKPEEFEFRIISKYPTKTVTQSLVYYKQRQLLYITLEPKVNTKLMYEVYFNTDNGIDFSSRATGFNSSLTNFFKYSKKDKTYDGQLEFWPKQPIRIGGKYDSSDGLYFSLQLKAFGKTWYDVIDYQKSAHYLDVSIEILPGKPITLELDLNNKMSFQSNMKTAAKGILKDAKKYISDIEPFMREGTKSFDFLGKPLTINTDWDSDLKMATVRITYSGHVLVYTTRMDLDNYIFGDTYSYDKYSAGWLASYDAESNLAEFKLKPNAKTSYEVLAELVNDTTLEMEFLKIVDTQVTKSYVYKLDVKMLLGYLPDWDLETIKKVFKDTVDMVEEVYKKTSTMASEFYKSTMEFYSNGMKAGLDYVKKMIEDAKEWYEKNDVKGYVTRELKNFERIAKKMWEAIEEKVKKVMEMDYEGLKKYIKGIFEDIGKAIDISVWINVEIYKEAKKNVKEVMDQLDVMFSKHQIKIKECTEKLIKDLQELALKMKKEFLALEIRGRNVEEIITEAMNDGEAMIQETMGKMKKLWEDILKDYELDKMYTKLREMNIKGMNVGEMMDDVMKTAKEFYEKWSLKTKEVYEQGKEMFTNYLKKMEELMQQEKLLETLKKTEIFGKPIQEYVNEAMNIEAALLDMYSKIPSIYEDALNKAAEMYEKLEKATESVVSKLMEILKSASKHYFDVLEEIGFKLSDFIEKSEIITTLRNDFNEIVDSSIKAMEPLIVELQEQMMGIMVRGEPVSIHMKTIQGMAQSVVQQIVSYSEMEVSVLVDMIKKEMEKLYKKAVEFSAEIPMMLENLKEQSLDDVYGEIIEQANKAYKHAGDMIEEIQKELTNILSQIKDIDFSKMFKEALDKLPKDKVTTVYNNMMKVMADIKEKALTMIEELKEKMTELKNSCKVYCDKVIELGNRMINLASKENIVVELEGIFNEVKVLMKSLYETVQEKLSRCYEECYLKMKKMYAENYGKAMEMYSKVEKHVKLFYQENDLEEVFEDAKKMVQTYYNTASDLMMEKYTTLRTKMEELYKTYEPQIQNMITIYRERAEDMYDRGSKMYKESMENGIVIIKDLWKKINEMIDEYGDYTWEELTLKLYKEMKEQTSELFKEGVALYDIGKLWVKAYYEQAKIVIDNLLANKEKYITDIKKLIKKLKDIYESEIYPRVDKVYKEKAEQLMEMYGEVKTVAYKVSEAVGVKVLYFNLRIWRWYTDNQDKPLSVAIPALIHHLKEGFIDQFYNPGMKMFDDIKVIVEKWTEEMKTKYRSFEPELKVISEKLTMIYQDAMTELTKIAEPCVTLGKEIANEYYTVLKKYIDTNFWIFKRIYQVQKENLIDTINETRIQLEQFLKKAEATVKEFYAKILESTNKWYTQAVKISEQYRATMQSTVEEYKTKIMENEEVKKFLEREDVKKAWNKMKDFSDHLMQYSPAMAKDFILKNIPEEWVKKYDEILDKIVKNIPEKLKEYKKLFDEDVEDLVKVIRQDVETLIKELRTYLEDRYTKSVNYMTTWYAEMKQKVAEMKTDFEKLSDEVMKDPKKYFDENVLPTMKKVWEMIVKYVNNPESLVTYLKERYPELVRKIEEYKKTVTELTEAYVSKLEKEVIPEIKEKVNNLSAYLKKMVPEKYEEYKQKVEEFKEYLDKLKDELTEDPKKYWKLMSEKIMSETKRMLEKVQEAMPKEYEQYKEKIQEYMDILAEYGEDISKMDVDGMKQKLTELKTFLEEKFPEEKKVVEEVWVKAVQMIDNFKVHMTKMSDDLLKYVERVIVPEMYAKIDELVSYMEKTYPEEMENITMYRKEMVLVIQKYTKIVRSDILPQIEAKFNQTVEYIKTQMPALYAEMKEKFAEMISKMEKLREEITADPELYWKDVVVPKAEEIFNNVLTQMKETLPEKFTEYKEQILKYKEMISTMTMDDIKNNINLDSLKELQVKFDEFVKDLKENFPDEMAIMEDYWKKGMEKAVEIKEMMKIIMDDPKKYLTETVIPTMKREIENLVKYLEEKYPDEIKMIEKYRVEMMEELEKLTGKTLPELREKVMTMVNTLKEKTEKLYSELVLKAGQYYSKMMIETTQLYNSIDLDKAVQMVKDRIDVEEMQKIAIGYRDAMTTKYQEIYKKLILYLEENFPKQMKQIRMYVKKVEEIVKDPSQYYTNEIVPRVQEMIEYLEKEYPMAIKRIREVREKVMHLITVYSKRMKDEIIPKVKKMIAEVEDYMTKNLPEKVEEFRKIFEKEYRVKFEEYKKIYDEYKIKIEEIRGEIMADPKKFWNDKVELRIKEKYNEMIDFTKTLDVEYLVQIYKYLKERFPKQIEELVKDPSKFYTEEIVPAMEKAVEFLKNKYPSEMEKVQELQKKTKEVVETYYKKLQEEIIPEVKEMIKKVELYIKKHLPEKWMEMKKTLEDFKLQMEALRKEIMADPQKYWDEKVVVAVKEKYEEINEYMKENMPKKFEEYKKKMAEFREEFENHLIIKDPRKFISTEIVPKLQAKVQELLEYVKKNYPEMVKKVEEYQKKIAELKTEIDTLMADPKVYMNEVVVPKIKELSDKFVKYLEKTYPKEMSEVKKFGETLYNLSEKYITKIKTEMYPQAKEKLDEYIVIMKEKLDAIVEFWQKEMPERYHEIKRKAEEFKQQLDAVRAEIMADPRKYWEDVIVKKIEIETEKFMNYMKTTVPEKMKEMKSLMEKYRKELTDQLVFKDPKMVLEMMKEKLEEMIKYLKEKFPKEVKRIEEFKLKVEEFNEQYKQFVNNPKKYVNEIILPEVKLALEKTLEYLNTNYPKQYAKVMDVVLTWEVTISEQVTKFRNVIIPELKKKLDEVIEFFKTTVPEKYEEVKAEFENLKEKLDELRKEVTEDPEEFFDKVVRPKVTKQISEMNKYLDSNIPRRYAPYRQRLINYREEVESMTFFKQSLDYIKSNGIPQVKEKLDKLVKFLEDKFPEELKTLEEYKTKMNDLIDSYSAMISYELVKDKYNSLVPWVMSYVEKIKIATQEYIQEAEQKYNQFTEMTPKEIVEWVKEIYDEAVEIVKKYEHELKELSQNLSADMEEYRKVAIKNWNENSEKLTSEGLRMLRGIKERLDHFKDNFINYSAVEGYNLMAAAASDRIQAMWSKLADYINQMSVKAEELKTMVLNQWKRCPISKMSEWKDCPISPYVEKIREQWTRVSKMTVKESITLMKELYAKLVVKVEEVKTDAQSQFSEAQKTAERLRSEAMELYSKIMKVNQDDVKEYVMELVEIVKKSDFYTSTELKVKEIITSATILFNKYDKMMKEFVPYMTEKTRMMMEKIAQIIEEKLAEIKERFPYAKTTLEYIDSSMGLRDSSEPIKITRQLEDYFFGMKKTMEAKTARYMKKMRRYSKKTLIQMRKMTLCLQDGWKIQKTNDEYILSIRQEICPVSQDIQVPVKEIPGRLTNYTLQWMENSNCTMRKQIVTIIRVTRQAAIVTKDIASSDNFPQAVNKTRKVVLEGYKELLKKYDEMLLKTRSMYKKLSEINLTAEYMKASNYYWSKAHRFYIQKLEQAEKLGDILDWNVWPLRRIQWSPPFNSTAMIFGRPHVYTFDGKYFEFPGYRRPECTYVLARDFHDGNFTLLSQEKSMIILSEDGHIKITKDGTVETVIKILPDGKIVTDGHAKELPVELANTTVSREGSVIKVVNTRGLEVICDLEHFLCTINVAGWYHNKLAGILGTNNNEQYDEFTLPTGEITSNIAAFVNAWEITKAPACRIREDANLVPICNKKASLRCEELLNTQSSPLAKYFKYLTPEPFLKACKFDTSDCSSATPKEIGHCDSVAAYISLLKVKGYNANYLKECGRCDEHKVGQSWKLQDSKAVDFVVLLPESPSMKTYTEDLPRFLKSMSKEFNSLYKTRFAVVAFGGKGKGHNRAHHVTLGGKLFGDARELTSAVQNIRFLKELNKTSNMNNVLDHVIDLPFRAGASKVVILLTDTDRVRLPTGMSLEEIAERLQENDLTFNVIGNYKFKGAVVGQDASGKLYSRKQTKGVMSSQPLPLGEHIELVKATNGSVFSLKAYYSGKKDVSSSLERSMANALKAQIQRDQDKTKTCMCYAGEVGQGVTKCRNTRPASPFPFIQLYNYIQ